MSKKTKTLREWALELDLPTPKTMLATHFYGIPNEEIYADIPWKSAALREKARCEACSKVPWIEKASCPRCSEDLRLAHDCRPCGGRGIVERWVCGCPEVLSKERL